MIAKNFLELCRVSKRCLYFSWNKLLAHTELLDDIDTNKLRDKDRQLIKDKFAVRYEVELL